MPSLANTMPSSDLLHARLRYDDMHGHLYWRPRPRTDFVADYDWLAWNTKYAMRRADGEMQNGYMRVRFVVGGAMSNFQAHRIIWKMVYGFDPFPEIDHIDRDRTNNRQFNLRIATRTQNCRNRTLARDNGRNHVGVYPTRSGKFRSQTSVSGKITHLGTFDTAEAARAAFISATSR